jgi:tetratricopeptide (TPR) repeat protein
MEVSIWQEEVVLPTYRTGAPDKNPMFFENRVYQGSSGVVYPNPVIESIEDEKTDQTYQALFLENKYLKIMILPEIGGRVHMAFDKIANRHFIYYNQVIKPALVGLCGPWISGGIEFNWPQHHRPSTFEPIDYMIENNDDGSKTVWVSEVEKMFHTKGMAGFTLYPDKAYLEIKAQLFNRTNLPQTFLWWANPAVHVNEHYQSIFPPDVHAVFDHGKRDVSSFPIATGTYYKVDYSPGTDISRYKNIPVPTSYMAVGSKYNFVGGYEHDKKAGMLHVADHHVSPGKKQWTWGNGDFGIAWDRNLTDEDGPYIELMTGVYTDNQPDFAWIMPNEEKSFTQYFLPYRQVGAVKNASKDLLLGLDIEADVVTVRVFTTSEQRARTIRLKMDSELLFDETVDLSPEKVFEKLLKVAHLDEGRLLLSVSDHDNKELLTYQPDHGGVAPAIPDPASPARAPKDIDSIEQLFLTGQHLEQYRHATYSPVPYYEEALAREPGDVRSNNALGTWYLRRGKFEVSESYFRKAIETATQRNPNPYDGEPYYNLGLSLHYQQRIDEAYDAFFKAVWSSALQDSAYFAIAKIDIQRGDYELALEHINWSLDRNARNGRAYMVKVHALRKLNRIQEAVAVAKEALTRDHFNLSVLFELHFCYLEQGDQNLAEKIIDDLLKLSRGNAHTLTDFSIEFADLGLFTQATELLLYVAPAELNSPLINYYIAYYWKMAGNLDQSYVYLIKAAGAESGICFPNRLEDILVLQYAIKNILSDAKALYCLGNLWYDKKQYQEAMACWEKAILVSPSFPTAYRNLAIAVYNKQMQPEKALNLFEKAFQYDTSDARVMMELDQLYKRMNKPVSWRLDKLKRYLSVVQQRDDLYLEMVSLENFSGNFELAYKLLMTRKFHPWEGGEGKASGQYVYSLTELAKQDIANGSFESAIRRLNEAQHFPHSLGEGKLYGAQENDIFYWLGCAYAYWGDRINAELNWKVASQGLSEPSAAVFYNDQQPDKIFYQGLAWEKLGESSKAENIFRNLVKYGEQNQDKEVRLDYFAVSLPDLLIFDDDLQKRNFLHCRYISGLGYLGLKKYDMAEQILNEVLERDAMHFGAKTHLRLSAYLQSNAEPVRADSIRQNDL